MGSSDCRIDRTDERFALPAGSAAFLPTTEVAGISPRSGEDFVSLRELVVQCQEGQVKE